ncbi:MAG: replicative DNA helicase [Bacilli bacterium]|nr:replicative DNA helicase [Bacilli bacterium]MBR1817893.1 replicative DNA helicase [Bacilli bacterium]
MAERVMPQNIEAEMSVLGVAFLNPTAMESIMENMSEDMFFSDANKRVFQALSELYKNRTPIDITTVKNELDKQKNLNAIGGVEYLSEIVDSVATSANLNYYMEIVKDKATRRKLIDTATNIITDAYNETNGLTQILDTSETKLLNVVRTRKTSEFKPITEALREAHENLERLSKNKSAITGLPTGFIDLDKATSGLHEGEMIIIAARPGMGKTAFALNLAVNAAMSTDKAVAIFNLEMSAEQLVNRMISAVGQIEGDKLKTGMLSDNDWKRYTEAMSELSGTNIYIEDDASVTAPEIKAKCRRLASSPKGLALVVIDYLQLVTTGGRVESRQVEVSEISRAFKTMAMELKVPVIALAQLSRNAERRESNQPRLADLRESGSIEQDADMVLFINRQDYFENKTAENKANIVPAEIIIAKHRRGSTGLFQLLFELNKSCFKAYTSIEEG